MATEDGDGDTKNRTKETVRISKTPRKKENKGFNKERPSPGSYVMTRKNCFGMVEKLDPLSVKEALKAEAELNAQLEAFLNGVATSATTRNTKKTTHKNLDMRKALQRSRKETPPSSGNKKQK